MRRRLLLLPPLALLLGAGGFALWKARAVARELVDPPFYKPQPLARVEATYADLAKGDGADPGGAWEATEVEGLQLWRLKRARASGSVVLLLHGFGDDRWGTSPALRWFPERDAAIFTYRRRDDALRRGGPVPPVTFGAREAREAVAVVHALEAQGYARDRILLMGRSLGASVGLLALSDLEREGRGPLAGLIWEGAPASSTDFAERLVRGPEDRFWHPLLAPAIGRLGAAWAARAGRYEARDTEVLRRMEGQRLATPALLFLATQDRLAPAPYQRAMAAHFARIRTVEVPTWHLHCSEVLGPAYAQAIRDFSSGAASQPPK